MKHTHPLHVNTHAHSLYFLSEDLKKYSKRGRKLNFLKQQKKDRLQTIITKIKRVL